MSHGTRKELPIMPAPQYEKSGRVHRPLMKKISPARLSGAAGLILVLALADLLDHLVAEGFQVARITAGN